MTGMASGRKAGDEETLRKLTPEQFQAGYIELVNGVPQHRSWALVRKLEDGNYVVLEPKGRGK